MTGRLMAGRVAPVLQRILSDTTVGVLAIYYIYHSHCEGVIMQLSQVTGRERDREYQMIERRV